MTQLTANDFRSRFQELQFDEEAHKYWTKDGEKETTYTSVTTILHKYEKDTFTDGFLTEYALKHHKPKDIVRRQWDVGRDFAGLRGTELHLYIESFLQFNFKFLPSTPIEKEIGFFHDFWDQYSVRLEPVDNELRVYNKGAGVSGTIDFLARSKVTGKYHIIDWKTNKDVTISGREKFLAPLDSIDNCHLNKFSLQLGMYRWILQQEFKDISFGDNFVVWMNHRNESFKLFKCLDLTGYVENIMTGLKETLDTKIVS